MIATSRPEPGIAVVTMDRPERLNAVDGPAAAAMSAAIDAIEADAGIRCWILTGTGRAFCAGADLKALADRTDRPARDPNGFAGLTRRRRRTPVVAAVNGLARGAGVEFLLACDLAVMASGATLGLPESSRGLLAAEGGLVRLGRILPPAVAAEVVVAGRVLDASEAERFGLVNRVVEPVDVLPAALELARSVVASAPLSVDAGLHVLRFAQWAGDDDAAWRCSDERSGVVNTSDDAREGARAFADKRQPVWRGS